MFGAARGHGGEVAQAGQVLAGVCLAQLRFDLREPRDETQRTVGPRRIVVQRLMPIAPRVNPTGHFAHHVARVNAIVTGVSVGLQEAGKTL